ncbi:MAG: glycosyltransferase 87 family protein [Actinomycetota bacterium]
MEGSHGRSPRLAVAAAVAGFLIEAVVAAVPGSPLQPVLAPGADPGGPFVWIAETIGLDRLGAALPVVSVLAVAAGMAGFLLLLRAAWRGEVTMRLALGLSIAFHLAIVLLPLLISRDVYSYIAHGQIVSIYHANPYVDTPADFPSFLTRQLVGPKWVDTPSVYGPLFAHLSNVVTRTSPRLDVLVDAFRLVAIAASLATTFVIGAVSRRIRPSRAVFAVAAFGLNPVVLFQSAASGHNDLLVALAVAAAAWCVIRDRTIWAVAILTCGALIKATAFLPLLLLVVWVVWWRPRSERLRAGATHAGVTFAIVAIVAAPFFQLRDPTLGMLELSSHEGWLAPSRFFRRVLDAVSGETLGVVARVIFALALVVAVVWLVRAVALAAASGRPSKELLGGWGLSLLALTLIGPVLLPWYLAWSLPLIWVLPRVPRVSLIVLSGVLALSQWTAEPLRFPEAYDINVLIGHYALTPVVIAVLVWLALDLWRRATIPLSLHGEDEREAAEARQGAGGQGDAEPSQP